MALTEYKRSRVLKHGVVISGRGTSVCLEDAFWHALREIAIAKGTSRPTLVAQIASQNGGPNLSSAVHLFVIAYYQGSRS